LNELQVDQFIAYRDQFGPFLNALELQAIPDWDVSDIRRLMAFSKVESGLDNRNVNILNGFYKGDNEVLIRYGYPTPFTFADRSEGPGNAWAIRVKHSFDNRLRFGFTAESDPGEAIFKGSNKHGFDFYSAHLFFQNVDTPHKFLLTNRRKSPEDYEFSFFEILDLVSAFHLAKFPLVEPQRMTTVLNHMKSVISLSRESWRSILAETDRDREWIPNPKQLSVVPQVRVTEEMVDAWMLSLDEITKILDGKKNLPFWRDPKLSIDFPRIFTEPLGFDLMSWVQGTAATPYLEKGTTTDMNVWNRMVAAFGSNLFGFVVWFN
jgi:hypothetical protein